MQYDLIVGRFGTIWGGITIRGLHGSILQLHIMYAGLILLTLVAHRKKVCSAKNSSYNNIRRGRYKL